MTEAISYRMKELAHQRQTTLNDIIKRSNINQSTISEIVNGRSKHPRVSTIHKFCKGCGISMKEFFDSPLFDFIDLDAPPSTRDKEEDDDLAIVVKMPPK